MHNPILEVSACESKTGFPSGGHFPYTFHYKRNGSCVRQGKIPSPGKQAVNAAESSNGHLKDAANIRVCRFVFLRFSVQPPFWLLWMKKQFKSRGGRLVSCRPNLLSFGFDKTKFVLCHSEDCGSPCLPTFLKNQNIGCIFQAIEEVFGDIGEIDAHRKRGLKSPCK